MPLHDEETFEFGARNVVTQGDWLPLINILKSHQIHDTLAAFSVRDIISLIANFDFISWSLVKRGDNKVAHYLPHRRPYSLEGTLWQSVVPDNIVSWASDDIYTYIDVHLI